MRRGTTAKQNRECRCPKRRASRYCGQYRSGVNFLANVKDEPRPWLARAVLLGARLVTAMVVGSGALLGVFLGAIDSKLVSEKLSERFNRFFERRDLFHNVGRSVKPMITKPDCLVFGIP